MDWHQNKQHAIIWTNDGLYVSLGLSDLAWELIGCFSEGAETDFL